MTTKTVNGVEVPLTPAEEAALTAERAAEIAKRPGQQADVQFEADRVSARPAQYDDMDLEVLQILRQELQEFDNGDQANTPLIAIVAGILPQSETVIRDAVRNKGNDYYVNLVTAWANRRLAKGGA